MKIVVKDVNGNQVFSGVNDTYLSAVEALDKTRGLYSFSEDVTIFIYDDNDELLGSESCCVAEEVEILPLITRQQIFNDIIVNCLGEGQGDRILDALDSTPSVMAALDNFNYDLAYERVQKAFVAELLLQEDLDLIYSKFPAWWTIPV